MSNSLLDLSRRGLAYRSPDEMIRLSKRFGSTAIETANRSSCLEDGTPSAYQFGLHHSHCEYHFDHAARASLPQQSPKAKSCVDCRRGYPGSEKRQARASGKGTTRSRKSLLQSTKSNDVSTAAVAQSNLCIARQPARDRSPKCSDLRSERFKRLGTICSGA